MTLTNEQIRAIRGGEPVEIVLPEVGTECVVVRKDVYDGIKHLFYEDTEPDPSKFYPLVNAIMAEDDADDPALDSYQKYRR